LRVKFGFSKSSSKRVRVVSVKFTRSSSSGASLTELPHSYSAVVWKNALLTGMRKGT